MRTGHFVRAGNNTIEIKVTNLCIIRLIGDLQSSAPAQFTHTNTRDYAKDSLLLTSGILAPVAMQPENLLRWR
ncbi:MAG TPA: hypothetical protein VME23_04090 [Terracidiphilus sp.]|nr:hypothetical protein [Terracidiphilus sp.]